MTTTTKDAAARLQRRFEACIADWDGTLVPNRTCDAGRVREVIEGLCAAGFDMVVITGTHVENVDGQLRARPAGPGRLLLCVNRGSEVFSCDRAGPALVARRVATAEEDTQLDRAAALTVERLRARGLEATIVAQRLNRRKVDIIPLPEWADPPKARITELVAAVEQRLRQAGIGSVVDVVRVAHAAASEAGLADARISSDAKYVEIGLTDKSDAARWAFDDLWESGVGAADLLVAGDEFGRLSGVPGSDSLMLVAQSHGSTVVTVGSEPSGPPRGVLALAGGPDRMLAVLEDQLMRRQRGEPPTPRPASGWRIDVDGTSPETEPKRSAVLTLADGYIGTTGAPILHHPSVLASTLVAGFYDGECADEHLRPCPAWNQLSAPAAADAHVSRLLDLRTGVIQQSLHQEGTQLSAVGFSSLAEPGTAVLWVAGDRRLLDQEESNVTVIAVTGGRSRSTCIDMSDVVRAGDGVHVLERIAVYSPADTAATRQRAGEARARGVNALHRQHRQAWASRWRDADVLISGDEDLQRKIRYSLFQLMSSVSTADEAALGARGLSGDGYRGHVFWDSDVFALPFLAATCPPAARAMLEYRARRLGAAMQQARELGRAGARFPWESASTGRDITPASVVGPRGETVPVRTGELEDHIVVDVAWAACRYVDWTADDAFRQGPLASILVETARYWASRVDRDADGSAHIRHVIGPDEYHEDVDDNAFTNVMARWNLRAAADRAAGQCDEHEVRGWNALADQLVDNLDRQSLVYEQFTGYSELMPFPLREVCGPTPVAADAIIGFDRIRSLQVVKQADVLMLHLLVPGEVAPGSLQPNMDRYLPVTAHGSSLSPAVHAALLARLRRYPEALELLRHSAGIDVAETSPTTAHGLHIATMGGVWMALAEGFAGIRADGDGLIVHPRLPTVWQDLTVHLLYRGVRVAVRIDGDDVRVDTDRPLRVTVTRD